MLYVFHFPANNIIRFCRSKHMCHTWRSEEYNGRTLMSTIFVWFIKTVRTSSHESKPLNNNPYPCFVLTPLPHATSHGISRNVSIHDDVIKWKHFPRCWPFVGGIHRSPVNSPHKGQWRGALMFSLICALNKQFTKQSWGWWFGTPSRSLWRHCNAEWSVPYTEKFMHGSHMQLIRHMA